MRAWRRREWQDWKFENGGAQLWKRMVRVRVVHGRVGRRLRRRSWTCGRGVQGSRSGADEEVAVVERGRTRLGVGVGYLSREEVGEAGRRTLALAVRAAEEMPAVPPTAHLARVALLASLAPAVVRPELPHEPPHRAEAVPPEDAVDLAPVDPALARPEASRVPLPRSSASASLAVPVALPVPVRVVVARALGTREALEHPPAHPAVPCPAARLRRRRLRAAVPPEAAVRVRVRAEEPCEGRPGWEWCSRAGSQRARRSVPARGEGALEPERCSQADREHGLCDSIRDQVWRVSSVSQGGAPSPSDA